MNIAEAIQTGQTSVAPAGQQEPVGKQEFLNLLVTQLKHQDPSEPMDDKQFIAQLAQFSALEQSMEMNQRLALLQATEASRAHADMAGLVGQTIEARSNFLPVGQSGSAPTIQLELGAAAADVKLHIVDQAGRAVRTLDLGARQGGSQSVVWDTLDGAGDPVNAGLYSMRVEALDSAGRSVAAEGRVRGVLDRVTFDDGAPTLWLDQLPLDPAQVVAFEAPEAG